MNEFELIKKYRLELMPCPARGLWFCGRVRLAKPGLNFIPLALQFSAETPEEAVAGAVELWKKNRRKKRYADWKDDGEE